MAPALSDRGRAVEVIGSIIASPFRNWLALSVAVEADNNFSCSSFCWCCSICSFIGSVHARMSDLDGNIVFSSRSCGYWRSGCVNVVREGWVMLKVAGLPVSSDS